MPDDVRVEVLGYAELAAGSRVLFKRIGEASEDAFAKVAEDKARELAGAVPRLSGALAGSVEAQKEGGGALVSMGAGIPYARFVEYGGRGHPRSAQGNYLYPVAAGGAESLLEAAGVKAADDEIGDMRWPSPR